VKQAPTSVARRHGEKKKGKPLMEQIAQAVICFGYALLIIAHYWQ
jgi:hypothetical protein